MNKLCAFCGTRLTRENRTKEHVFPRNLYPQSKRNPDLQLLTVPCCETCNNSWSDDEAHFRMIMMLAGDPPTKVKQELWEGPVTRGFDKSYGQGRLQTLIDQMVPVELSSGRRHMIYPARDDRVLRVVRKIIKGLLYEHNLPSPVPDRAIKVYPVTFNIPVGILSRMEFYDCDLDIVEYGYTVLDLEGVHTIWLLNFFHTVSFLAGVLAPEHWDE